MSEDRLPQIAQHGPGLQPEILVEPSAEVPTRLECIGVTAGMASVR